MAGQGWHGLRKLSLENGNDQDVVSEGLAWEIERAAAGELGYGYEAGHRAWVRLIVNDYRYKRVRERRANRQALPRESGPLF